MLRNSHCSYCGHKFEEVNWPRTCAQCNKISYINPLPVVALIVPFDKRVITVRRGEEPGKGMLGLPGGYLDVGETWQEGAARELREETGIIVGAEEIQLISVASSLEHNSLLIFCRTCSIVAKELDAFKPNREVTELVAVGSPQKLAFPTHTQVLNDYLSSLKS